MVSHKMILMKFFFFSAFRRMIVIHGQGCKSVDNMNEARRKIYKRSLKFDNLLYDVYLKKDDNNKSKAGPQYDLTKYKSLCRAQYRKDMGLAAAAGGEEEEDDNDKRTKKPKKSNMSDRISNKSELNELFKDEQFIQFYTKEGFYKDEVNLFYTTSSTIEKEYITYSPKMWTCNYWDKGYTNLHEAILHTVIDREDKRWAKFNLSGEFTEEEYDAACLSILGTPAQFEDTVKLFRNYIDDVLDAADAGMCWDRGCVNMVSYATKLKRIRDQHGRDLMSMAVCAVELSRRIRLHNYNVNNKRYTTLNPRRTYNQSNQRLPHGVVQMVRSWLYTYNVSSQKVKDMFKESARKMHIMLHDYIANDMSYDRITGDDIDNNIVVDNGKYVSADAAYCPASICNTICPCTGENVEDVILTNKFSATTMNKLTKTETDSSGMIPFYLRECLAPQMFKTFLLNDNGKYYLMKRKNRVDWGDSDYTPPSSPSPTLRYIKNDVWKSLEKWRTMPYRRDNKCIKIYTTVEEENHDDNDNTTTTTSSDKRKPTKGTKRQIKYGPKLDNRSQQEILSPHKRSKKNNDDFTAPAPPKKKKKQQQSTPSSSSLPPPSPSDEQCQLAADQFIKDTGLNPSTSMFEDLDLLASPAANQQYVRMPVEQPSTPQDDEQPSTPPQPQDDDIQPPPTPMEVVGYQDNEIYVKSTRTGKQSTIYLIQADEEGTFATSSVQPLPYYASPRPSPQPSSPLRTPSSSPPQSPQPSSPPQQQSPQPSFQQRSPPQPSTSQQSPQPSTSQQSPQPSSPRPPTTPPQSPRPPTPQQTPPPSSPRTPPPSQGLSTPQPSPPSPPFVIKTERPPPTIYQYTETHIYISDSDDDDSDDTCIFISDDDNDVV